MTLSLLPSSQAFVLTRSFTISDENWEKRAHNSHYDTHDRTEEEKDEQWKRL